MNQKTLTPLALLLVIALLLVGCSAPDAAPDPGAELTPSPDLPPSNAVVADGRVVPLRSAALSLETGGVVSEILVVEGDEVQQGEPLIRLSTADQLAAAAAAAELQVITARQELAALQDNADVATALAMLRLANARDALKDAEYRWRVLQEGYRATREVEKLAEANFLIAEDSLDKAQDAYDSLSGRDKDDPLRAGALAQLVGAQNRRNEKTYQDVQDGIDPDDLELGQARLAQAEAQLKAAETALAGAELRAPFAGVVTALDLRQGEFVAPGIPLAWIADFSDWRIETTDLGEIDAVNVRIGDTASITLDALPDVELSGTVESISGYGQTRQGDITYKAVLRLEPPYPELLWNMTAYVTIFPELTVSP